MHTDLHLIVTDLNTAHKDRSRLYHIVENDFASSTDVAGNLASNQPQGMGVCALIY